MFALAGYVPSVGAITAPQLADLQLQSCHGRYFFDGGSNTGDSVRSFLSGAPWPPPPAHSVSLSPPDTSRRVSARSNTQAASSAVPSTGLIGSTTARGPSSAAVSGAL